MYLFLKGEIFVLQILYLGGKPSVLINLVLHFRVGTEIDRDDQHSKYRAEYDPRQPPRGGSRIRFRSCAAPRRRGPP